MKYAFIFALFLAATVCTGWAQDSKFPRYGLELDSVYIHVVGGEISVRCNVVDPIGGAEGKLTFLFLDENKNVVVSEQNKYNTTFSTQLDSCSYEFKFGMPIETWAKVKSHDIIFAPRKLDANRITLLEKEQAENAKEFKDILRPLTEVYMKDKIKQGPVEFSDVVFTLRAPKKGETSAICYAVGKVTIKNGGTRIMHVDIEPVLLTTKKSGLSGGRLVDGMVPSKGRFTQSLDPGETVTKEMTIYLLKRNWDKVQEADLKVKVQSEEIETSRRRR